ncbi:hypothetical protein FGADI_13407 [Fusarium gaditjirri]|uniref:Uncharacterized protein n=1 Tax=Fusarium gaditjirri TaxID=282569 RepID=A0A8H4SPN9_9HYPO|nr:hypothetical protein FGADI_13407 [Fusarium gaditjirri]
MASRTLISDRKSRKRELDPHLETLVANFQEADSDVRFSSLNEQLSEVTSERDRLRGLLESLNFTIRSHLDETPATRPTISSVACKDGLARLQQKGPDISDSQETEPFPLCSSGIGNVNSAASISISDGVQAWDNLEFLDPDPLLLHLPPFPQTALQECECMLTAPYDAGTTLNFWRQVNDIYQSFAHVDLAAEDQESEDSIIRAVLYGWDSVGPAEREPATCRMLRSVDELPWVKPNPTDRLAILNLMRLMLVSQNSTRKAELPRWLQARPSQSLPHAIAIDFVFW